MRSRSSPSSAVFSGLVFSQLQQVPRLESMSPTAPPLQFPIFYAFALVKCKFVLFNSGR
ncbi:hypothetical protein MTR_8g099165 [Medicago truncatula]|uniref:Uncharacterized protein n=1 Tax=Medicago truncatula TaxID=3880 RepID=A0A072TUH2_MEDTR|nr:hypothetical protein MTR_8g099165 [Medicago truncatula]